MKKLIMFFAIISAFLLLIAGCKIKGKGLVSSLKIVNKISHLSKRQFLKSSNLIKHHML
ncbi:hypothetical protein [Neobacillus sp.]|uniref:hypothetical protein n=1 Tax=Neobacillus sp. TaxID=2675273 RepID=UPI0028A0C432|nr:hypothetical protein [Neobacillus sp.]